MLHRIVCNHLIKLSSGEAFGGEWNVRFFYDKADCHTNNGDSFGLDFRSTCHQSYFECLIRRDIVWR